MEFETVNPQSGSIGNCHGINTCAWGDRNALSRAAVRPPGVNR